MSTECKYQQICGGCPLRHLAEDEYRQFKIAEFKKTIQQIKQDDIKICAPVFINDGNRRRAELAFLQNKGKIVLGFNAAQSHEIIDIENCLSLTAELNEILPQIRNFLQIFCSIEQNKKVKNKIQKTSVKSGDIWLTQADNGIDILLQIKESIGLEHRMEISDFANRCSSVLRVSVSVNNAYPETVAEKVKPYITMGNREVLIPTGTFLQASTEGQQALIDLVLYYIGETQGNIADLFCGVGTFSYPLSQNIKNKITAIDSSQELLDGFKQTVNKLMLPNIKIVRKNLFKYPLDANELKEFDIVVFDPPRAGAKAQVEQISAMPMADKPQKIVAVSCNPHTFVNDANNLIEGGYYLKEITMVDQFVYARHFELVALFEK